MGIYLILCSFIIQKLISIRTTASLPTKEFESQIQNGIH